ncbi:MAG: YraN family protein [Methanomassiliicoccales archaeon]|nr:MAG: YraN family protein [Methanomassiliicoccales archaeon]
MLSADRRQLGKEGERVAVQFLKSKQLCIRETNFRCAAGEIDIVAEDDDVIVFVEVKTRRNSNYGLPEEAVHYFKQKKLLQLAMYYLQKEQLQNKRCRFDVISIIFNNNKIKKIDHFVDAFSA